MDIDELRESCPSNIRPIMDKWDGLVRETVSVFQRQNNEEVADWLYAMSVGCAVSVIALGVRDRTGYHRAISDFVDLLDKAISERQSVESRMTRQ